MADPRNAGYKIDWPKSKYRSMHSYPVVDISPSISFSSLSPPDIMFSLGNGRPRCRLTPSLSMPDINCLGLRLSTASSWSPNLLSGSLPDHIQVHNPVTALSTLRAQVSHLKRRIYGMEIENNELKHANMVLCSDSQALDQELSNFRADYYAERFQSKVRVQCARADKDKIIILNDKLEQAENFIMAMVDIKLHEPVLGRAAEAVKQGADAEDALIDAVRMAANKKGSAWSRIIPAVVGPRSPEHYLSAINLALMLQKDLHEREKICSFWKMIAKLDPINTNAITPSSSLLSEVGGQDVEHSRSEQAVLDEMISLLEKGDTLSRKNQFIQTYSAEVVASDAMFAEDKKSESLVASVPIAHLSPELALHTKSVSQVSSFPTSKEHSTQATPLTKALKTVKVASVSPPMNISRIPVSPPHLKVKAYQNVQSKLRSPVSPPKVLSSISPAKSPSPSRASSKQTSTPIRKAPLTPIRSRLSTPRTNTFKRPVLTSIDLNKPVLKMNSSKIVTKLTIPVQISDDTIRKTRDHSKDLAKRRGVIMEEISHSCPNIIANDGNTFLPMTAEIEVYEPRAPTSPPRVVHTKITKANNHASTTEGPIYIPPMSAADKELSLRCTEFDLSFEVVKHGSLLAAQALQSLERICAAFSSDTLGSLEITDVDDDYELESDLEDLRFTSGRISNVVTPCLTNLSHIHKALHDHECSIHSDSSPGQEVSMSVDEDPPVSDPPRPPTPIVKCSTWASSIPHLRMSSTSAASSSSSSCSESISVPVVVHDKKLLKSSHDKSDGSPTPARTTMLASPPKYLTDRSAKSLKSTFYKAVPPLQTLSLLPIEKNTTNSFRQPPLSSQNKPSASRSVPNHEPASFGSSPAPFPCKPRSNTINTVSPLPPNLPIPMPETPSSASPFKRRSNTNNMASPACRSPRPERFMPPTKPRANTIATISSASRSHTEKTISSSAKRRSNTLDSYLQVPSKNTKSPARIKAVSSVNDAPAPTAAFMRRPDVKTALVNTGRTTNSDVAPLIPNWASASHNGALFPTQYRNMLRGGANMVI